MKHLVANSKAIKVTGSHFTCVSLQLKSPIRRLPVSWCSLIYYNCHVWTGRPPASSSPPPSAFTKNRKTVWWLWEIQLQKQICIFSIYLTSHTWLCSPQALASLLAAPPSHYLNSEFLSGFSQFSHTFNLWRNEWWLLSIKKKTDRLTAHTGGLVSSGDEVFLCAAVCLFDGV